MHKITPFLWFDTQAEEAMNHYVSIFRKFKGRTRHAFPRRAAGRERCDVRQF